MLGDQSKVFRNEKEFANIQVLINKFGENIRYTHTLSEILPIFSMISTLDEVSKKIKQQKKLGKKVGLITGCFDVLHFEHIQLFRFAKKHVDFLVVGLDNDKTISLFKGKNRPINGINQRLQTITELKSVDVVFEIKGVFDYSNEEMADKIHIEILKVLKPDYLVTAVKADKFWQTKKHRAKHLQIKFLPDRGDRSNSSTTIIDKLTK